MRKSIRPLRYVSTHSRPKAAGHTIIPKASLLTVSTHSRPKAAGSDPSYWSVPSFCFNTQPPEGGWAYMGECTGSLIRFQHTAARRRLETFLFEQQDVGFVSTHSRPKAAGL